MWPLLRMSCSADRTEEDHGRAPAKDPCHGFRGVLRGVLASPAWHELPAAASLCLALRFVESVVTAAHSDAWEPSRGAGGQRADDTRDATEPTCVRFPHAPLGAPESLAW